MGSDVASPVTPIDLFSDGEIARALSSGSSSSSSWSGLVIRFQAPNVAWAPVGKLPLEVRLLAK